MGHSRKQGPGFLWRSLIINRISAVAASSRFNQPRQAVAITNHQAPILWGRFGFPPHDKRSPPQKKAKKNLDSPSC